MASHDIQQVQVLSTRLVVDTPAGFEPVQHPTSNTSHSSVTPRPYIYTYKQNTEAMKR